MLILLTENQKAQRRDGIYWHGAQIKFQENPSTGSLVVNGERHVDAISITIK
jgi:hypothetical protein